MSAVNNGGPAFPHDLHDLYEPDTTGMTLRDYFAAKAMQAYVGLDHLTEDGIAVSSYEMADAMLRAREAA
jgi:hypothetical protein